MLKLFRKKNRVEETSDKDWWKNPCLDDEGTYDYLVTPLPSDKQELIHDSYKCRCEYCGKRTSLYYRYIHYFYTIDGWDSLDSVECWRCALKEKIRYYRRKLYKKYFSKRKHGHKIICKH